MCSCQLQNRSDMNIQNVFLLVMEHKGYEHLNVFLVVVENKGYENLECVLASYGIERI